MSIGRIFDILVENMPIGRIFDILVENMPIRRIFEILVKKLWNGNGLRHRARAPDSPHSSTIKVFYPFHNRSKSFQSTSVSRPTLRQFDACVEHARPWLCDSKFMQLLVRRFKDESENATEEAASTQETQKSAKSSRSKSSSIANTSKSTLNSSIGDDPMTNWQILPEIIQQLFKSYQISDMEGFGTKLIAPIVQVFADQVVYTPALINLMRIILKSEPFREAGIGSCILRFSRVYYFQFQ